MSRRFAGRFAELPRRVRALVSRAGVSEAAKAAAPQGGAVLSPRVLTLAALAAGLFAGYIACAFIESALMSAALGADTAAARAVGRRAPSFANAGRTGGAESFAEANPFKADVRAVKEDEAGGAVKATPEALKSFALRGTLPGIGAWIETGGQTRLVLTGQKIEGFTLSDVKYSEATLSDGTSGHPIYLLLSGCGSPDDSRLNSRRRTRRGNPPQRRTETRAPEKQELDFSGLEPASEGQEGAVPRELVDALLMNPYDELAKVRMIPTPDASGMKLESLAPDSVLARVGVAQGDVISAINGVNITNVADASNALNSLIAGSRFDVTVLRGGKPVELRYQVK